ncbi:Bestrophin, RFP-TM, chloride channel-domain-containing protein [Mycena olivaceomarginata]|nr:Bestrophin, RFP-TM, chloride channel-domain-containing protein [Mycena olivaceomarginata]
MEVRSGTLTHKGFAVAPDPFAPRRRPGASFFNALLATALFRCWHILLFFAGWSTLITVLDQNRDRFKVRIASTLLTVVGTVLGFVVSYRTTSSFERYNEGRRLWSQIILASRTFARIVWFHVPDLPATKEMDAETLTARGMVEKKTVINLLEAYGVAVKHYLRGEDGIYYQDLYYLVKFLPRVRPPPGIPSNADLTNAAGDAASGRSPISPRLSDASAAPHFRTDRPSLGAGPGSFLYQRQASSADTKSMSAPHLPLPATSPGPRHTSFSFASSKIPGIPERPAPPPLTIQPPTRLNSPVTSPGGLAAHDLQSSKSVRSMKSLRSIKSPGAGEPQKIILARADEAFPPPRVATAEVPPLRPIPVLLMLSILQSSYIAALQKRKQTDVPTINSLIAALNNLVDALTGLERILTTPIPFSYSIHLWVVTTIYCLCLPSQIVSTMGWLTIPGTSLLTFIFFGFLVAGEEIENPFGYDKNDLNLDHFTHNIIRNELRAITSAAAPDPDRWIFSPENDMLFATDVEHDERVGPNEWVRRGSGSMLGALSVV